MLNHSRRPRRKQRPHLRPAQAKRRRAAPALHADGLSQYRVEIERLPLLTRQEELELAREIEALDIAHWGALLSYRPALARVALAANQALQRKAAKVEALAVERPRRQRAPARGASGSRRRRRAIASAARELRVLDEHRTALREVDRAIDEAFRRDRGARAYLARIGRARRAHAAAKERFVSANLRLVASMAGRRKSANMPHADLIQEGNLGLMRAVERFDHRRGLRFSTYATWWIRHYINRAITDKAPIIRVPVHALDARARVTRVAERMAAQTGRPPSPDELAGELGLRAEDLQLFETIRQVEHPRSLDRPFGEHQDQTWHERLADPESESAEVAFECGDVRERIEKAMAVLSPFEAAIVRYRFGFDGGGELTLREVGEKYNLSRERIRQVQEVALTKLRDALRRDAAA